MNGEHFQFPDTDPCEIVDIEATLHLSYEDKDGKRQVGLTSVEYDCMKTAPCSDPEGDRGPDPPGKSQVIWVSR